MGEPHFVSCVAWIPKGICQEVPSKAKITSTELAKLIKNSTKSLQRLEARDVNDDQQDDETSSCSNADDTGDVADSNAMEEVDDGGGGDDPYNMAAYDTEDETEPDQLSAPVDGDDSPGASFSARRQTELLSDSGSEADDWRIRPDESVIVVGQVDGDLSQLVFYVFDEKEGSVFLHHDILLSSYPLCLEWLGFDASQDTPGNLLAVGTMLPQIELWPVDTVNCLEPVYTLGEASRKRARRLATGHTDAVTTLAWNRHLEHLLASGSADGTVLLWDLHRCAVAARLPVSADGRVQSAVWRQGGGDGGEGGGGGGGSGDHCSHLLTGDSNKFVSLWECKTEESQRWELTDEVEQVVWDHFATDGAMAVTSDGKLHYIDVRQKGTVWSVQAHTGSCSGMWLSRSVVGCAMTASGDGTVRVWHATPAAAAQLVAEPSLKLGALHCVAGCAHLPWTVCLGGDNRDNSFRVWDLRHSDSVREKFNANISTADGGSCSQESATMDCNGAGDARSASQSISANANGKSKKMKNAKLSKRSK